MKRVIYIIIVLTIISCTRDRGIVDLVDIKYFTKKNDKVGTHIKSVIDGKKALFICYPEYVSQSYDFLKYVGFIAKENGFTEVYHPLIKDDSTLSLENLLITQAPLLGFEEFISLYNYYKSIGVNFVNNLDSTNKLLILSPEEQYKKLRLKANSKFNGRDIIYSIVAGTKLTTKINPILKILPEKKKIGSVILNNSSMKNINKIFYNLILLGEIEQYRAITPIKLYTEENFMLAPMWFQKENSLFFESLLLRRLNSALPKRIKKRIK